MVAKGAGVDVGPPGVRVARGAGVYSRSFDEMPAAAVGSAGRFVSPAWHPAARNSIASAVITNRTC